MPLRSQKNRVEHDISKTEDSVQGVKSNKWPRQGIDKKEERRKRCKRKGRVTGQVPVAAQAVTAGIAGLDICSLPRYDSTIVKEK